MKVFTSVVVGPLLLLLQAVNCLHFYLDTAQTRCFFEELPRNTLVIGKIDAQEFNEHTNQYEKNPALNLRIAVMETFDNDDKVADQYASSNGDFAFTSSEAGEHKFCLTPTYADGTKGKKHRIFFDIAAGSSDDYIDSKSSRKVDALTLKVQTLNKKLDQIHFEQEYIRQREAHFRDQSESTNSRVVKWGFIQLVVLVGTCFYQLRHLKSFFVKQKIV